MAARKLKNPRKVAELANYRATELTFLSSLVRFQGGNTERSIAGYETARDQALSTGTIDTETLHGLFPGRQSICIEELEHTDATGHGFVESVYDLPAYQEEMFRKREELRIRNEKAQRAQAEAARLKRLEEQQKQAELELAQRLGITPERLAQLQGRDGLANRS